MDRVRVIFNVRRLWLGIVDNHGLRVGEKYMNRMFAVCVESFKSENRATEVWIYLTPKAIPNALRAGAAAVTDRYQALTEITAECRCRVIRHA